MPKQEKQTLLPKLRFPEFREAGAWSKEKLGAVATLHKGKGISKAEIVANGVQPCIRYGELYTIYGETIHETASSTNVDASELFLSKKNDVIIPASGETKIDIAKASCVMNDDIALGGDLNVIRSSQNGIFLSYQLNGPLRLSIAKVAQGDTVVHLYLTQIERLDVLVPSPPEQQKIADCLASLDELITLEAQQLDTLKTHKKGLMQQLFPAEGETLPKLRFPGFREAWVETPLGSLCSSISSGRDQIDPDGAFDLYGSTSVIGKTRSPSFSGERLLVARVGANAGLLTKAKGAFGVTDNTLVVSLNPSINMDFLFHYLGSININRLIFGSGQPLITGSILKNLPIPVPADSEQQKISACLSSLGEMITDQSCKLEAIKAHKNGLMQQLFPSIEEVEA